jgi:hypothetical protein
MRSGFRIEVFVSSSMCVCDSEVDREEDGERSSEGRADSILAGKLLCPDVAPLDSLAALDRRQQQLDQGRQRKPSSQTNYPKGVEGYRSRNAEITGLRTRRRSTSPRHAFHQTVE